MKKRIYNDTFGFEVFITDKKKHFPSNIPRCEGISQIESDTAYLYIRTKTHRVLVHECIHIAQGLLNKKGIKTGYKNTEVLAYVTDWIYNEVLKLLEK